MEKPAVLPTPKTYNSFQGAYDFFNKALFGGKLPPCLVTLQRQAKAFGYFAGERFGSMDGKEKHDEIAMNPAHFAERSTEEILSTLAHEMAHLWQHHFGTPSRAGYHNKEWASKMLEIGLVPSDTGAEGGKQVGQKVGHYIQPCGLFEKAYVALAKTGFEAFYVDLWGDEEQRKARKTKAASKTKFTCPECQMNAWAKASAKLICGACQVDMEGADDQDDPSERSNDERERPRRPARRTLLAPNAG